MNHNPEQNQQPRNGLQFLANQHPAVVATRVLQHAEPADEEPAAETSAPPPAPKSPLWPDPSYLVGLWRRWMGNLWVRQSDNR